MYFYQAARQKQERKIKVIAAMCFAGLLLFIVECGKYNNGFLRELAEVFYQELVSHCLPVLDYCEEPLSSVSIEEHILNYFFPVLKQGREIVQYQTDIESEFSYEMILAMEAADENYVDMETGLVVGDTSLEELEPEMPAVQIDVEDGFLEQIGQAGKAGEAGSNDEAGGGESIAESKAATVPSAGKTQKTVSYSREKLADFDYLLQNFYRVDRTTTINSEQLNAMEMLAKDMTLTHDASSPQILIYHTHSQEGYVDSIAGDPTTTVVGVGDYLTELLEEQYGLNVIHHKGEYDVEARDDAYSSAGPAVEKILAENPSIEVVIDLHRDGVGEDTHLVTNIDGVDMAKIMFVNGLSRTTSVGNIDYLYNPNLADNLAFSFQTQLVTAEYYPGLSRGVYLKGYRYNLHYCPKSLLVEVGAQTNTLQEAKNAMVPLADILNKVVTGINAM